MILSLDPMGYDYAKDNPVMMIDPSGLCGFGLPCPKPLKDAGKAIAKGAKGAAETIEIVSFGIYAGSYTVLDNLGELPDYVEVFLLPIEVNLTLIEGAALGLSATMDYLASGNITNVENDPSGERLPSDWWPDWLVDESKCVFPCTKLPGISAKPDRDKEGGFHLDIEFQWPLGR